MLVRVQIRNWTRTRLLGPETPLILPQEVVIIRLIHYESNLGRLRGTLRLKPRHHQIRIITNQPHHHIRACLRLIRSEGRVLGCASRLMERRITYLLSLTFRNLLRVIHIHRIRETIVSFTQLCLFVPAFRIICRLPTSHRRFPRARVHMYFTECLSRKRRALTCQKTLTLILAARSFYLFCLPLSGSLCQHPLLLAGKVAHSQPLRFQ